MSETTPKKNVSKFKDNLINVGANKSRNLFYIKRAFGICFSAFLELREWINQFNFAVKNENHFLKVAKPYVFSNCLLHYKRLELEAMLTVITKMAKEKYLKNDDSRSFFFFDRPQNSVFLKGADHTSL